jgi:hypothetical protein
VEPGFFFMHHLLVIPAKAGIQFLALTPERHWIPAFAGMTKKVG